MKKLVLVVMTIMVVFTLSACKDEEKTDPITNYDHLTTSDYYSYLNTENPDITIDVEGYGIIVLQLFPSVAPNTVNNFIQYIEDDAYNGNVFHRVIEGFMVQGGDISETACNIKGDFAANGITNPLKHSRGVLSMARVGGMNDSQTSQFFIMHDAATSLDNQYASFGGVISGIDVVDRIAAMQSAGTETPSETITINSITVDLKGKTYEDRVCASDYVAPVPVIDVPEDDTIVLADMSYYDLLSDTNPTVSINVKDVGTMVFELFPSEAPNTVNNFISLINDNAYDGNEFYKTIADLLLQGGYIPNATCAIAGEMSDNGVENDVLLRRGVLGMSRDSQNMDSARTEFFILASDYENLDGAYAGFGGLVSGANVLDYLTNLQIVGTTNPSFDLEFESITVSLNGYTALDTVCITE